MCIDVQSRFILIQCHEHGALPESCQLFTEVLNIFLFVTDTAQNATRETDPHRLEQRLRQITYGKNTLGYASYTKAVPKYVTLMAALLV